MPEDDARPHGRVFPVQCIRIRRSVLARMLSRLSVAALLVPLLLVYVLGLAMAQPISIDFAMYLFTLGVACSVVLALASLVGGVETRSPEGTMGVRGDHFTMERSGFVERIPRANIVGGLVLRSEPGVELYLGTGAVIRAGMRHDSDACALLDDLGFGADGRRIVAVGARANRVLGAGCAAYPASFVLFATVISTFDRQLGAAAPLVMATLVVVMTLIARRIAGGSRIVIGAEGVSVDRRFARFEEISRVARDGSALIIDLSPAKNGAWRRTMGAVCADAEVADAILARLEEGRERARGGLKTTPLAEVLDPGERPVAAWREDLAKLLSRGDRYRSIAIEAGDLLDVIDDPSAPPKIRIGAAIAIRERRAPEDRARLRIAADACADPHMREALEAAAAEGEIDDEVIRRVVG